MINLKITCLLKNGDDKEGVLVEVGSDYCFLKGKDLFEDVIMFVCLFDNLEGIEINIREWEKVGENKCIKNK